MISLELVRSPLSCHPVPKGFSVCARSIHIQKGDRLRVPEASTSQENTTTTRVGARENFAGSQETANPPEVPEELADAESQVGREVVKKISRFLASDKCFLKEDYVRSCLVEQSSEGGGF
jgi:hypothetical protein